MEQTSYLVLFISSLFYIGLATDDSFLQMKNLETYTTNLMKIYDTNSTNPDFNTSMLIHNFFTKVKNFTDDLAKNNVDLRFHTKSTNYSSYWKIPEKIQDDLKAILTAIEGIDQFFTSYYTDFLDDVYTQNLIEKFVTKATCGDPDSLYRMTAQIKDNISSHPLQREKGNFFNKISDKLNKLENFDLFCGSTSTRQQFLISFYSLIIRTQFKAMLMLTSAYKLNSILLNDKSSNYLRNIKQLKTYFLSKSRFYLENMQVSLENTYTEYCECNAKTENYFRVQNIYAIDSTPVIVDYKWNKVVTKIQVELRHGIFFLILHDGTLLENGRISTAAWDSREHYSQNRERDGYLRYGKLINITSVDRNFWKNISFLHTRVPENHVIVGANFEVLKSNVLEKQILYFKLHYAEVNITTGNIDTSNIKYTKVYTQDDPELQQHPDVNKTYTFMEDSKAAYNKVLVNENNFEVTERWRRKAQIRSYIDSSIMQVHPLLPITGISLWKNEFANNFHYLSVKISTMNISSRVDPRGQIYRLKYFIRKY